VAALRIGNMSRTLNVPDSTKEVTVNLPTRTAISYIQTVVGKKSTLSDHLDEFQGIPFGEVTKRWEHAKLRTHLPRDIFDATKNGYVLYEAAATIVCSDLVWF
jgi:hypothetical protein